MSSDLNAKRSEWTAIRWDDFGGREIKDNFENTYEENKKEVSLPGRWFSVHGEVNTPRKVYHTVGNHCRLEWGGGVMRADTSPETSDRLGCTEVGETRNIGTILMAMKKTKVIF